MGNDNHFRLISESEKLGCQSGPTWCLPLSSSYPEERYHGVQISND